jgi:hypothetical protein
MRSVPVIIMISNMSSGLKILGNRAQTSHGSTSCLAQTMGISLFATLCSTSATLIGFPSRETSWITATPSLISNRKFCYTQSKTRGENASFENTKPLDWDSQYRLPSVSIFPYNERGLRIGGTARWTGVVKKFSGYCQIKTKKKDEDSNGAASE